MEIRLVEHPLLGAALGLIRDKDTEPKVFRHSLTRVSSYLIYEALKDHPVQKTQVQTPLAKAEAAALVEEPLLVPVLRAGLGMLEAGLTLLPDTQVGFVGMSRDESTLRPHLYADKLPADIKGRTILVLDPMLATGGSLVSTLEVLGERGAGALHAVCVLASKKGVETLSDSGLAKTLTVAAIDPELNEVGFIVPGLGDAGDRQYGI